MQMILPPGWPRPKGYANAVLAEGRLLSIAGQIGWDEQERLVSDEFLPQLRQALRNVRACLQAAGGSPQHLVRVTWYLTDRAAYVQALPEVGRIWREELGRVFPAMTAVIVAGLIEAEAKVEIEATAILPLEQLGP